MISEEIGFAAAENKYEQVIFCKLRVSGKDWLLPNIQSRKHSAVAAERRRKGDIKISPNTL